MPIDCPPDPPAYAEAARSPGRAAGAAATPSSSSAQPWRERVASARRLASAGTLLDAKDARVEEIWRTLEAAARPVYFLT
jgi:hypothetical protein